MPVNEFTAICDMISHNTVMPFRKKTPSFPFLRRMLVQGFLLYCAAVIGLTAYSIYSQYHYTLQEKTRQLAQEYTEKALRELEFFGEKAARLKGFALQLTNREK